MDTTYEDDIVDYEVLALEADAEIAAEFTMSFVCGGGLPEDAAARYAMEGEL